MVAAQRGKKNKKTSESNRDIRLDLCGIDMDPAKRQVAKLSLYNIWGKFAKKKKKELTQTSIVKHPNVI